MKKLIISIASISIIIGLAACGEKPPAAATDARKKEAELSGSTAKKSLETVGNPQVRNFAEKANLRKRYEELDDPKATGYIYLMAFGKIVAEYTVKGKVSSMNSQFTNPEMVVKTDYGEGWGSETLPQQEPDGSYGDNPEGIFFWNSDGIYIEWSGDYLYSKRRLEIQQPTENILIKEVK